MLKKFPTIIHERVELARQGRNQTVICKMKSGWAVLGDDQRLPGYSLLLHDPIEDNLNCLKLSERLQFLTDMTTIGDSLIEALSPSLINYSILGNTDRALHAHIHPRYDTEPMEKRKTVPFIYHIDKLPYIPFEYDRDKTLMSKLRKSIEKRNGLLE